MRKIVAALVGAAVALTAAPAVAQPPPPAPTAAPLSTQDVPPDHPGAVAIRQKWAELGPGGQLFAPSEFADGAIVAYFSKWNVLGAITWRPELGAHWFSGAIFDKWADNDFGRWYGAAAIDQVETTGRPGAAVRFANDISIYYSGSTGAHALDGLVRQKYWELGATASTLGFPLTDSRDTLNWAGRYADFAGLVSIVSPVSPGGPTGHWISGALRQRFFDAGGPPVVGWPISDQAVTPARDDGWFINLEKGAIYWSPQTGPRLIGPESRQKYEQFNTTAGPFGFPITDEVEVPQINGGRVDFQNVVSMYSSRGVGAHWISGALRQRFFDAGGIQVLGAPTTDQLPTSGVDGRYVQFGPDRIILWSRNTGARLVVDHWLAKLRAGGDVARYGLPTSEVTPLGTRPGEFQHFTRATLINSQVGFVTIGWAIRATWWSNGGVGGVLGLPNSEMTFIPADPAHGFPALWYQDFEHGRVRCTNLDDTRSCELEPRR